MNLEDFRKQAVDLSQVAKQRDADEDARTERAMDEARKVALAWDRAMRRAFKGILPRPVGRAMLMRASEKQG